MTIDDVNTQKYIRDHHRLIQVISSPWCTPLIRHHCTRRDLYIHKQHTPVHYKITRMRDLQYHKATQLQQLGSLISDIYLPAIAAADIKLSDTLKNEFLSSIEQVYHICLSLVQMLKNSLHSWHTRCSRSRGKCGLCCLRWTLMTLR